MMVDAVLSRLPFVSAGARRISPRVASEAGYYTTEQCRQWATGESRVVVRAEISLPDRSIQLFNSHVYTNITKDSDVIKNALNSGYSDSWLGAGKAEAGLTGGQQLSTKKLQPQKELILFFLGDLLQSRLKYSQCNHLPRLPLNPFCGRQIIWVLLLS
jgi:hypothetical protein